MGDAVREPDSADAESADSVSVETTGPYSANAKWEVKNFSRLKKTAIWSRYFEVGGYSCRHAQSRRDSRRVGLREWRPRLQPTPSQVCAN